MELMLRFDWDPRKPTDRLATLEGAIKKIALKFTNLFFQLYR